MSHSVHRWLEVVRASLASPPLTPGASQRRTKTAHFRRVRFARSASVGNEPGLSRCAHLRLPA